MQQLLAKSKFNLLFKTGLYLLLVHTTTVTSDTEKAHKSQGIETNIIFLFNKKKNNNFILNVLLHHLHR